MHRLRTFRKAKEEDESIPPVPTPPSNHKGFKWGKSSSPPPKQQPELDLQHVLPPTDDFRTSLLMPNLAQRFSILQMEQAAAAAAAAAAAGRKANGEGFVATGVVEGGDGPAHAPSAFAPLGDIAETSSIAGSTIGTAIQQNRLTTKSEESSNLDQDGSIMNRSRGGEGNVLFGGRQKVYRVPTGASRVGSSEDLPGRSASPMSGRVVYDHDVTDSAFAKPRKGSQDRGASMEGSGDYNKNRFTSSSTNSTPTTTTRLSTAATSVASNTNSVSLPTAASVSSLPTVGSGSMASSKPRRPLYEQALDQQLQDHQNSAAGRLERLASIRKLGTTSPPMASYANGNNSQPVQQYTSPTSPTSIHNGNQWPRKRPDSPLSPPEEVAHEEEEKTAELGSRKPGPDLSTPNLGTFNFGLESVSRTPLSPPVSASTVEFPAQGPFSPGNPAAEQAGRRGPERVASPPPEGEGISLDSQRGRKLSRDEDGAETRTFLSVRSNSSESSYGDESDNDNNGTGRNVAPLQLTKQPTVSIGGSPESVSPVSPISPASNPGRASDNSVSPNLLPLRNPAISPTSPKFSDTNFTADDDSPTLPPAQGLGVLVRQHLRSDSGHSSVYAGSTYTRVSRNSRHGANNGKQASVYGASKGSSGSGTARPSGASGSSGGNLWEFDDWDGVDYADDEHGPPSPSTISDSQGIAPAPSIPQKAPGRTEAMPDLKSGGDKREEGDWNRERELAASRAGERERNRSEEEDEQDKDWEQQLAFRRQIIQQNLRNQEKVNSQHDMPFPSPDMREGAPRSNGPGFNILKSKSSNGFLAKGDPAKVPRGPGMEPPVNGPPMRPDVRGRMVYDEERMLRDTVRGPHNMPPPHHHHHPMHQPPHHLPPHPRQFQGQQTLAAGQPYNRYPPGERSPIGLPHPLHSPMHAPRMRPRPSQEQMNSAQSTPRGVPMGWRDENWGLPRSAPGTQPGTPTTPRDVRMPRKQPSMPGMSGRRDDMRQPPNQGQQFRGREDMRGHDRDPRRHHPGGPPPHHPPQPRPQYDAPSRPGHESVETSPPPPSHDFRRPRNGSNASPAPTMRQRRGTLDSTPLPPLNTSVATAAALAPPKQSQPSSAVTPYSAVSSDKSPAIAQRTPTTAGSSGPPAAVVSSAMANIQNSNAGFAPAKKRAVDKSQIGEPKLLSATSNIPTRALPPQDPTPPLSDPSRPAKPRGRRMTTTQNIFSGFGKNKSSEEVPVILPPSSNHRSDDEIERSSFTDDPPPKKSKGGKLRKSTSDGGALASRSRQQAMTKSPSVPRIQKVMVGVPAHGMDTPGGMI